MKMKQQQRGGTIVGFILGLLVGLGVAVAVAVYATKMPVPFLNKSGTRPPGQDAAEAQRNKNWDPNAPLYGKTSARRGDSAPGGTATSGATAAAPAPLASPPPLAPVEPIIAGGQPQPQPSSSDPMSDLIRERVAMAPSTPAPFNYFVQAGAFRTQQDADAQRARLAMLGWQARVSILEQHGRAMYRVRVGPFDRRDDAETLKNRLDGAGVVSTLVRVAL